MFAVALLYAVLVVQDGSVPTVGVGDTVAGVLASGGQAELRLDVGTVGDVTLSVESFEFAPRALVVDAAGAFVDRSESEGPGRAAWIVLDVPRRGHTLIVDAADGGSGRFLVTLRPGRHLPPEETPTETLVRLYTELAGIEQSRGDVGNAMALHHQLGQLLLQRAEHHAARPVLERALELSRELGNEVAEVAALAFLGAAERRIGDVDTALDLLTQAWERRDVLGTTTFECFVLENLGEAEFRRGDLDAALTRFADWAQRAQAARLAGFEALACSRIGRIQELQGDVAAARAWHDRALELQADAGDAFIAAQVLLAAGRFHHNRDDYARARSLLERGLPLSTTWDVALHLEVHLGLVATAQGRYGDARAALERARARIHGREDGRFDVDVYFALVDLALHSGDPDDALLYSNEVLEIARAEGDRDLELEILVNRGVIQERIGELEAAAETNEQALALCAAMDRADLEGSILLNQGRLLRLQERYLEAHRVMRAALDLAERHDDATDRAAAHASLAYVLLFLDDLEQARHHAQAALELHESLGRIDRLLIAPLHTLARIELAEGRLDEAEGLLARADAIIERDDILELPPLEAAGVRSGFVAWGEVAQDLVLARLAVATDDAERAAIVERGFHEASRWKGRALLEGLPPADAVDDLQTTLRAALGPDRVLVEFAGASESLLAYVLDEQHLTLVELGSPRGLQAQVDAFLAGMNDPVALASAEDLAAGGAALYARLLAPTLERLDEDVAGLVIVPTPSLSRVPFEALVLDREDTQGRRALSFDEIRFVADVYHVTYGPSTTVLARLAQLGPRRDPGRLLIVADPVYASEAPPEQVAQLPASSILRYPRLVQSREEALAIAEALLLASANATDAVRGEEMLQLARLRRERSGVLESDLFDLYLGADATKERLSGDLGQYAMLHIAAHGEVDVHDPLRSGLVLSFDGQAHGYLSAADLLALELDADLVVLSACETASGEIVRGEGIQSLASAVLQAGSRGVLASLWSVDDRATRETMSGFYESLLLQGRTHPEALRDAKSVRELQQALRHGRARGKSLGGSASATRRPGLSGHPYYWAPFIYVGAIP